ncbi:hypothetical protein BH24ACT22_BH24ACT22_04640 [soil metagenome]
MKTVSTTEAVNTLCRGGVVLVPTETVVGLLAAERGRRRLSEIKYRDPEKPIALLCATKDDAFALASEISALAEKLAGRYWPGPLTLVLPTTGGGTVGVRVPDHEVVTGLLAAYGAPLYATSANLSGSPAPADVESLDPRIARAVDAVLEGENGVGEASAVVDLSGDVPCLLRAGESLTEDELRRMVHEIEQRV